MTSPWPIARGSAFLQAAGSIGLAHRQSAGRLRGEFRLYARRKHL